MKLLSFFGFFSPKGKVFFLLGKKKKKLTISGIVEGLCWGTVKPELSTWTSGVIAGAQVLDQVIVGVQ